MNHGALFNGIGGFQLAAHWMGWQNVWHCEIDKFCNKVVKQHFPGSICYEDIKQFDAREWKGKIDIISGGFPCQPFSQAGKRKGTDDDRYLWPEMLRVIGEVQPRFMVGENVGGLINWDRGLVFEQVQADLEAQGYDTAAFILPAAGVNAPHRRDRIWFVAHARNQRCEAGSERNQSNNKIKSDGGYAQVVVTSDTENERRLQCSHGTEQGRDSARYTQDESEGLRSITSNTSSNGQQQPDKLESINDKGIREGMEKRYEPNASDDHGNVTDTNSDERCERRLYQTGQQETERYAGTFDSRYDRGTWENFPTQSPVCGRNDGISNRVDRIKALGNAIVPQIAYQLFKAIEQTMNH